MSDTLGPKQQTRVDNAPVRPLEVVIESHQSYRMSIVPKVDGIDDRWERMGAINFELNELDDLLRLDDKTWAEN